MAFIPVPNVAEVAVHYLYNGEEAVNVFHVEFPAPPTSGDLNAACQAIRDWWANSLQANVTNLVSMEFMTARDLTVSNGVSIIYNDGLPISGGAVVPSLPSNVTLAVKWGTGLAGRSFRGRTYHVGLGESQVNQNTIDSGTLTNYRNGYTDLITDITVSGGVLVVVSRYSNNAPRVTGIATPITTATIEPTVDTQRRRLRS